MSQKLPLFATAPMCKIYIKLPNGVEQDIAYAVGLNFNIGINIQEVKILGEFAVQSLEITGYTPVSGSFQVVRLLSAASQKEYEAASDINSSSLNGVKNADGTFEKTKAHNSITNTSATASTQGALAGQEQLFRHLDPRTILLSQSFDIIIKLKIPRMKIEDTVVIPSPDGNNTTLESTWLQLKDCRITSGNGDIGVQRILTESVSFQGLLLVRSGKNIEETADVNFKDGVAA